MPPYIEKGALSEQNGGRSNPEDGTRSPVSSKQGIRTPGRFMAADYNPGTAPHWRTHQTLQQSRIRCD